MTDLRGRAAYAAYRLGGAAASVVPSVVAEPAARGLGRAISFWMPARRAQSARHLARATDGRLRNVALAHAVTGAFDSYARYWVEMFQLPHASRAEIARRIRVDGYEHVEAALAAGKGAIIALPHLGGWEWAGAWLHAVKDQRPLVVVEAVDPPELFAWFQDVRGALGMEVVAADDDAARRAIAALRDNRLVCLVADRDLSGDGVDVEFFGERTTLPGGPALLALRTGAALLPTAVYFTARGGHRGEARPPLDTSRHGGLRDDVARITQALACEFESLIAAAPEQWHLMQPNWPSDRNGNGNGHR